MITEDQLELGKKILLELLQNMGLSVTLEVNFSGETPVFNVKTADSGILMGVHGANLGALQYLTRVLVNKKLWQADLHFVVDVEGYKAEREEFLRELARAAAARVRDTREILFLKPMFAFERRVVHAEISKLPDIMTESVGEEPKRRIVIRPRD